MTQIIAFIKEYLFICHFCKHNFTQKHNLDKHLAGKKCKSELFNNLNNFNSLLEELSKSNHSQEQVQEPVQEQVQENKFVFYGIFSGRENEIRITPNKMISVFDFIKVVGGQKNSKKTWYDIEKKYKNELGTFCSQFKFPGQGKTITPVINVQGMVTWRNG